MYCIYIWSKRIIIIRWNTISCLSFMRLKLNNSFFFWILFFFSFLSPTLKKCQFGCADIMIIHLSLQHHNVLFFFLHPLRDFSFSILIIILEHVVVFVCLMLVPLPASWLLLSLCLVSNKLFFKILFWSYSFF